MTTGFFCQTLEESLKDAAKLLRDGNATEAAKLLRAAKSSAGHGHAWQEVLKLLAEAEFKLEHYKECLAVGRELQSKTEQKSEVSLSLRQGALERIRRGEEEGGRGKGEVVGGA